MLRLEPATTASAHPREAGIPGDPCSDKYKPSPTCFGHLRKLSLRKRQVPIQSHTENQVRARTRAGLLTSALFPPHLGCLRSMPASATPQPALRIVTLQDGGATQLGRTLPVTSPSSSPSSGNPLSPPGNCPPSLVLQGEFTLKVMSTSKSPRGQGFPLEMLMLGEPQL